MCFENDFFLNFVIDSLVYYHKMAPMSLGGRRYVVENEQRRRTVKQYRRQKCAQSRLCSGAVSMETKVLFEGEILKGCVNLDTGVRSRKLCHVAFEFVL